MEILLFLIGLAIAGYFYLKWRKLNNERLEIVQINESRKLENIDLENDYLQLKQMRQSEEEQYNQIIERLSILTNEIYEKAEKDANEKMQFRIKELEQSFSNRSQQLDEKYRARYEELREELETQYNEVLEDLSSLTVAKTEEAKQINDELDELKAKQTAYINEKLRQEELRGQQNFYRMALPQTAINDIKLIREDLQPLLFNKEAVDKLIWEAYYKTEYDKLMSRLFKDNNRHCGIYKITCLSTDKAYIGQSVDIKERFKQHIKSGLSYAPSSNKLYTEMQNYGCENFMFEILEEVSRDKLNERETYWIDFYRTKDYGLNTTRGGA